MQERSLGRLLLPCGFGWLVGWLEARQEEESTVNTPNGFHLGTGTVLHQHTELPQCLDGF